MKLANLFWRFVMLALLWTGGGAVSARAATLTYLIDEDLSSQPQDTSTVQWSDNDSSSGFERYSSAGANTPRNMSSNYDHDHDPSTAEIAIPGGLEVNDDDGPVTLTAQVTLSGSGLDLSKPAYLDFFAGLRRVRGDDPHVTIEDASGNKLLDAAAISLNTGSSTPRPWVFNRYSVDLSSLSVGDAIKILWYGGGSAPNDGLELADIDFYVIPEPSSVVSVLILGMGGAGLRRLRNRPRTARPRPGRGGRASQRTEAARAVARRRKTPLKGRARRLPSRGFFGPRAPGGLAPGR